MFSGTLTTMTLQASVGSFRMSTSRSTWDINLYQLWRWYWSFQRHKAEEIKHTKPLLSLFTWDVQDILAGFPETTQTPERILKSALSQIEMLPTQCIQVDTTALRINCPKKCGSESVKQFMKFLVRSKHLPSAHFLTDISSFL